MTDADDLATAIAKEVAKQLPVREAYGDMVSPAAKEAGGIAQDIVKTLRLALGAFQAGAALQDRYAGFLNRSVRRVAPENLVSPAPQILGPVIEAIRYEPDDTPISDMFSELLSKAFDKTQVAKAHPLYPAIIRQLVSDEAILLRILWQRRTQPPCKRTSTMDWDGRLFTNRVIEIEEFPMGALASPENFSLYMEHLYHLGLVAFYKKAEEPINDNSGKQTGTRIFETLELMPMGLHFMKAVSSAS